MVSPISAAPMRRVVPHPRIVDLVRGAIRSWWTGWVRYASLMRGGVK